MAAAAAAAPPPASLESLLQQQPYTVRLDPDTARNLATNGATILLLDVPEATPIGIDQQVFLTGPRFRGVKMLPPGVHLLSYQARGRDGTVGPPVTTLLDLKPRSVTVRRWQPASEGLEELDEEEAGRYAAGVARFDFDRELAPYDLARYSQWVALSRHISSDVLQQLLPPDGEISIMSEAVDPSLMAPSSAAERRLQQQLQEGRARLQAAMQVDAVGAEQQQQQQQGQEQQQEQQQGQQPAGQPGAGGMAVVRGGRCRYSPLPRVVKVPGAPAAQLTALNVDKTTLLEQVMARYMPAGSNSSANGGSGVQPQQQRRQQQQTSAAATAAEPPGIGIVGELQFAFIAFVFGQSLEGYMQWKQLLVLMLGCVAGPLHAHISLFVAFLAALTAQLQLGFGFSGGGGQAGSDAAAAGLGLGSGTEPGPGPGPGPEPGPGAALLGAGLVEELLPDSFLRTSFRGFFEMLEESGGEAPPPLLLAQARVLEALVAAGLGWDFRLSQLRLDDDHDGQAAGDGEDDEDGPVVVELSEQQLAELEARGQ